MPATAKIALLVPNANVLGMSFDAIGDPRPVRSAAYRALEQLANGKIVTKEYVTDFTGAVMVVAEFAKESGDAKLAVVFTDLLSDQFEKATNQLAQVPSNTSVVLILQGNEIDQQRAHKLCELDNVVVITREELIKNPERTKAKAEQLLDRQAA